MKVKCANYNYNLNEWNEIEISVELKVYPCCVYHGHYEFNDWDDERFKSLPPDWNDLKKNDVETIRKTMFKILNVENFESDQAPRLCQNVCGVEKHDRYNPTKWE